MAFSEFYCDTAAGANINAGSTTSGTPVLTFTSGTWVASTGVFTATGADLSVVSVGMFASVYIDAATLAVFVGRITAVDDALDLITVSLTAKSGTAPTDGTGTRSIKVGGMWKGPNAAEAFPFGFADEAMTDSSDNCLRVNVKGGTTYSITAALPSGSKNGPIVFECYTTSAGDGGRATIDGGTAGASYVMLTVGAGVSVENLILQNNGATGSATGLVIGTGSFARRCVIHNVRGNGFSSAATGAFIECEAYLCNQSNTANLGGFAAYYCHRCISHDNAGTNAHGFIATGTNSVPLFWTHCIADTNGGDGFRWVHIVGTAFILNCDAYSNTSDGIDCAGSGNVGTCVIENCNLVKNGAYGITRSSTLTLVGRILNCGFGAGTQANTSGQTNVPSGVQVSGSVTYANDVTPWVDPADGDFTISLAAAKSAGRGSFLQTQSGYGDPSPTLATMDIGAGQAAQAAGGGGAIVPAAYHGLESVGGY